MKNILIITTLAFVTLLSATSANAWGYRHNRPWLVPGFVAPLPVARPHWFGERYGRHYGPSRYVYRGYRHNDSWKHHFGF